MIYSVIDLRTGRVSRGGRADYQYLLRDTQEMKADIACNYPGRRQNAMYARREAFRFWCLPAEWKKFFSHMTPRVMLKLDKAA